MTDSFKKLIDKSIKEKRNLFVCNLGLDDGYQHPFKIEYKTKEDDVNIYQLNSNLGKFLICDDSVIPEFEFEEISYSMLNTIWVLGEVW